MPLWNAGGQEFESPWLYLNLSKWDVPGSAKPSAKQHWVRRFALLLELDPPVRTPGLDPVATGEALRPLRRSSGQIHRCTSFELTLLVGG